MRKKTVLRALGLSFALMISTSIYNSTSIIVKAETKELPKRISGSNRYLTSVEISKFGWETSNTIVLTRGDDFADALSSVPLAKIYNSPVLLSSPDNLLDETFNEIKRLKTKNVIITGGYSAISKEIEEKLKNELNVYVDRIFGSDRYETSLKIAERIGITNSVFITSGNNFPDALSVASIAAITKSPIILSDKDSINIEELNYIKKMNPEKIYIIGGDSIISKNIENNFLKSTRIFGVNRFETNSKVLEYFSDILSKDTLFTSIGEGPNKTEFADALSGAALAAKYNSGLILVNNTVPSSANTILEKQFSKETKLCAFGGIGSVTDNVYNEIQGKIDALKNKVIENPINVPSSGGVPAIPVKTLPMESLKYVSGKLDVIYGLITNEKEKTIIAKIKNSIDNLISNPNYDYKSDIAQINQLRGALSQEEYNDLKAKLTKNIDIVTAYDLKEFFGM